MKKIRLLAAMVPALALGGVAFAGDTLGKAIGNILPVRLVAFDPEIRLAGANKVQNVTLLVLDGPDKGATISLHLLPSVHTGEFVGKTLYLKHPLSYLRKSPDSAYLAGSLLDISPVAVRGYDQTTTVSRETAQRMVAAKVIVEGENEIAGANEPSLNPEDWVSARQAVHTAEKFAPNGVKGCFALEVKSVGRFNDLIFLDSEPEYWDPRNLTVAISPVAAEDLRQKYGDDPDVFFKGKRLIVDGVALRVKIVHTAEGNPAFKDYYQTHVNVTSAHQIRVVP